MTWGVPFMLESPGYSPHAYVTEALWTPLDAPQVAKLSPSLTNADGR